MYHILLPMVTFGSANTKFWPQGKDAEYNEETHRQTLRDFFHVTTELSTLVTTHCFYHFLGGETDKQKGCLKYQPRIYICYISKTWTSNSSYSLIGRQI